MKRILRSIALIVVCCTLLSVFSISAGAESKSDFCYFTGQWTWTTGGTITASKISERNKKGKATFSFWDAGSYQGEYLNDHPEGYGTYTFFSGETKTGEFEWTQNLRLVMEEPQYGSSPHYSGTDMCYTGMTLNGEPYGYGELNFAHGGTFYGEFKDGTVNGNGTYVYLEPEGTRLTSYGFDWKMVSRTSSSLGGRWYSGLTLNGSWQGYGMLCYDYSYYAGEVVDQYCGGHGAYWQWSQSGDPSGTLTETKCGHYSGGMLQYSCNHECKFGESSTAEKIGNTAQANAVTGATQKSSGQTVSGTAKVPDLNAFCNECCYQSGVTERLDHTEYVYSWNYNAKAQNEYVQLLQNSYGFTLRGSYISDDDDMYSFDYNAGGNVGTFDSRFSFDLKEAQKKNISLLIWSVHYGSTGGEIHICVADGLDYVDTGDRTTRNMTPHKNSPAASSSSSGSTSHSDGEEIKVKEDETIRIRVGETVTLKSVYTSTYDLGTAYTVYEWSKSGSAIDISGVYSSCTVTGKEKGTAKVTLVYRYTVKGSNVLTGYSEDQPKKRTRTYTIIVE